LNPLPQGRDCLGQRKQAGRDRELRDVGHRDESSVSQVISQATRMPWETLADCAILQLPDHGFASGHASRLRFLTKFAKAHSAFRSLGTHGLLPPDLSFSASSSIQKSTNINQHLVRRILLDHNRFSDGGGEVGSKILPPLIRHAPCVPPAYSADRPLWICLSMETRPLSWITRSLALKASLARSS
jgi:hypothetical protein